MFGPSYSEKKLKINCKLAMERYRQMEKKKSEMAMRERKDIATFLKNDKISKAKIRVEHIIREDYLVEAMEIIDCYLELLCTRIQLITKSGKNMPTSCESCINSIIYAHERLPECKEMGIVVQQLGILYGKKKIHEISTNDENEILPKKLKTRLALDNVKAYTIEKYLEQIATTYDVVYTPDERIIKAYELKEDLTKSSMITFDETKNDGNNNDGTNFGGSGGNNFGGSGGNQFDSYPDVTNTHFPNINLPTAGNDSNNFNNQTNFQNTTTQQPPNSNNNMIYGQNTHSNEPPNNNFKPPISNFNNQNNTYQVPYNNDDDLPKYDAQAPNLMSYPTTTATDLKNNFSDLPSEFQAGNTTTNNDQGDNIDNDLAALDSLNFPTIPSSGPINNGPSDDIDPDDIEARMRRLMGGKP